jgi:hypothetical protein
MGLLSAGLISAFDLAGDKPVVPNLERVDPVAAQKATAAGNIEVLPKAGMLAEQTNNLNLKQLQDMLRKTIPGLDEINANASGAIADMTGGRLPDDVASLVRRNAAYKGMSGGFSGSSAMTNLSARDLGLTSLDLTTKGIDSAARWMSAARATQMPNVMDVSSMFLSPQQRIQLDLTQNENEFQRQWLSNRIDAMPSPEQQMWASAIQSEEGSIMSAAGSVAGMAGGGGGGM